jgi:hypothetical protein
VFGYHLSLYLTTSHYNKHVVSWDFLMLFSPARDGLTLSLSRPPDPLFVEDLLENHRIW